MSRLNLSRMATRVIAAAVVVAVLAGGLYYVLSGDSSRKVTANFASGVGVYPGTPVEILGIEVGSVTKVTPQGGSVKIEMKYDHKYRVPANAIAAVVANSLVSDRYLQLAPAYNGKGPTLADGADIPLSRTASPAELDDIYGALSDLSTALGPNGANKNGALSQFIDVTAANLKGNGAALGNSINALSRAASTLANGREDLFGTVKNLQAFTAALAQSDTQVSHFENQLAQVAGDLADERADLGAALHNLTGALHDVAAFVKTNAGKIHTDVVGLETITNILVKEQNAINESLVLGPVALANVVHAYQPNTGTLATRGNLASLADPAQICGALVSITGGLDKIVGSILGTQTSAIHDACKQVSDQLASQSLTLPAIPGLGALTSVLGQLPTIPGVGG